MIRHGFLLFCICGGFATAIIIVVGERKMRKLAKRLLPLLVLVALACTAMTVPAFAAGEEEITSNFYNTA